MGLQLAQPIDFSQLLGLPLPGGSVDQGVAQAQQQVLQAQQQQQQQAQLVRQLALQRQADAARQDALQNPTPANFSKLFLLAPQDREAITASHAALTDDQQRQDLRDFTAIHGLLRVGDTDAAKAALQRRIDADTKAGQDTSTDAALMNLIDTDPQKALGFSAYPLAAIMGPEKFGTAFAQDNTEAAAAAAATKAATEEGETNRHNLEAEAAERDKIAAEAAKNGTLPAAGTSGAPPAAPGVPAATAPAPTGGVYDKIATIAQYYGATPDEIAELQRKAQIESGGNPNASNGSSRGLFAFHQATLDSALGRAGEIDNPQDQVRGALNLQRADKVALQHAGVAPTPANAYILHQQGTAGGLALLTAPQEVGAVAAVTPAYRNPDIALQAIAGNIGLPYKTPAQKAAANAKAEQMTAGDFNNFWRSRWSGGAQPHGGGQPQTAAAQQAQAPTPAQQPYSRIPFQNTQGDDDVALTPDAVDLAAGKYLRDGTLPTFGGGKIGAQNKLAIYNRAADMAKGLGLDANDIVAGTANTKALGSALQRATQMRSTVEGSEQTVLRNMDVAVRLAPQGVGGSVPVFNRWIQAGRTQLQGDPAVSAFDTALHTVADEYAKVMTTATGVGGAPTSDSARQEAYRRLNTAQTYDQLQATMGVMRQEMANRTSSLRDVETGLKTQLRNGGAAPSAATPAPPTDAGTGHSGYRPGPPGTKGTYPVYTQAQRDAAAANPANRGKKYYDTDGNLRQFQ